MIMIIILRSEWSARLSYSCSRKSIRHSLRETEIVNLSIDVTKWGNLSIIKWYQIIKQDLYAPVNWTSLGPHLRRKGAVDFQSLSLNTGELDIAVDLSSATSERAWVVRACYRRSLLLWEPGYLEVHIMPSASTSDLTSFMFSPFCWQIILT